MAMAPPEDSPDREIFEASTLYVSDTKRKTRARGNGELVEIVRIISNVFANLILKSMRA